MVNSLHIIDLMSWLLIGGVALIGLIVWAIRAVDADERDAYNERRGRP